MKRLRTLLCSCALAACLPGGEPADGMDAAMLKETPPGPECGDGVAEWDPRHDWSEVCDGDELRDAVCEDFGYLGGTLACGPDCRHYDVSGCTGDGYCGNGFVDEGEACDDAGDPSVECERYDLPCELCRDDCTSFAGHVRQCGDGVRDRRFVGGGAWAELCDGEDLGGESCVSLGHESGELACSRGCQAWDLSDCEGSVCGNGRIEGSEECEVGGRPLADGCGPGFAARCDLDTCTWDLDACPEPPDAGPDAEPDTDPDAAGQGDAFADHDGSEANPDSADSTDSGEPRARGGCASARRPPVSAAWVFAAMAVMLPARRRRSGAIHSAHDARCTRKQTRRDSEPR